MAFRHRRVVEQRIEQVRPRRLRELRQRRSDARDRALVAVGEARGDAGNVLLSSSADSTVTKPAVSCLSAFASASMTRGMAARPKLATGCSRASRLSRRRLRRRLDLGDQAVGSHVGEKAHVTFDLLGRARDWIKSMPAGVSDNGATFRLCHARRAPARADGIDLRFRYNRASNACPLQLRWTPNAGRSIAQARLVVGNYVEPYLGMPLADAKAVKSVRLDGDADRGRGRAGLSVG